MFGNFDLADYGIEPSEAYEGGGPPVEEADDDEARDPPRVPRDPPCVPRDPPRVSRDPLRVTRDPPRVSRDAIESALGSTPAPSRSAVLPA